MQRFEQAPSPDAEGELAAAASEAVEREPMVVGVGASAGGLRALESLFASVPLATEYAFVVVQHLSPHYPSHMDELLQRKTRLNIRKVENGDRVSAGTIYLLPPKKEMTISNNRLWLTERNDRALALPINRFLESLAVEKNKQAIGVILSGTGSDGTHGCRRIRAAGGLVICQSDASVEFPSMPQNVERNGLADLSLTPEKIPDALARFARDHQSRGLRKPADPQSEDSLTDLEKLFALLVEHYDIDFKRYKTGTFGRRVQRRLLLTGANDLQEYLVLLRSSKKEADILYRDLLVNVTEFFRDPDSFAYLRNHVAPAIVAQAEPEIRVWTCGCRNLLIYLQAEAQQRALPLFHFALKKGGNLFLGRSESVGPFADDLETESAAHKVFVKATDKRINIPGHLSFSDLEVKTVKPVRRHLRSGGHTARHHRSTFSR